MRLQKQMLSPGPDVYYSRDFMVTLDSLLSTIRSDSSTKTVMIDPVKADVYAGDFYGFLNELGIPAEYHWIILRVNHLKSPHDFGPGFTSALVPDRNAIRRYQIMHSSMKTIRFER